MKVLLVVCLLATVAYAQKDPNIVAGRSAIVHLFEWKFSDVAAECERFLGPKGFAGVQLSPVNENLVIGNRPWWERYQPVSYIIATRSGNQAAFSDMVRRCTDSGVRIYVDVIPNHMTGHGDPGTGTGGSPCNPGTREYPAVPYGAADFHTECPINDYNNPTEVRNCELFSLIDLDQSKDYVRGKIREFLDKLVDLGVAGFRVDAAKHMWPSDLKVIYESVKNLNTDFGFNEGARPFFFQEVIDFGGEGVSKYEYTDIGRVNEFGYGAELGKAFHGEFPIKNLVNFGTDWGLVPGGDALVFIDNHDNQRADSDIILTHKIPKLYKQAVAFMLSWPFGYPRIMSSFAFTDNDAGPPADGNGNIVGPSITADGTCGNGWVCEHRWRQIFNMVAFRNVVEGTEVNDWWDNGDKQIAFCRGGKGFIAINNGGGDMNQQLQTCLPPGSYCDVISGSREGSSCSGRTVTVNQDGTANIFIEENDADGIIAIHFDSKTRDSGRQGSSHASSQDQNHVQTLANNTKCVMYKCSEQNTSKRRYESHTIRISKGKLHK